jgi:ADP-ribosylglycohydrolase
VNRLDRVRGCLLGLALGDAFGAPVEFASMDEIDARYGRRGLRELVAWAGHPAGSFTDDTQMTLATARGLLRAAAPDDAGDPATAVIEEYVAWRESQLTDRAARRAPGLTCLAACAELAADATPRPAANDSKGCGAVMRMAPAGLVGRRDAFGLGAWLGALTHGHPAGFLSAGHLSATVTALVDGTDLEAALAVADDALAAVKAAPDGWPAGDGWPEYPAEDAVCSGTAAANALRRPWPSPATPLGVGRRELAEKLRAARDAVRSNDADRVAVTALGGGWTGEEALAIAVLCVLRHRDDWRAAVTAAADHAGDSDSTACIAGALLGLRLGAGALPAAWLEQLEERAAIEDLAGALAAVPAAGR